jgi:hypothetical protein
MIRHRISLGTVTLFLFIGALTPYFAQNVPTASEQPDLARHQLAVRFLRSINTAEVADFSNFGSFAEWQTLLAHQPNFLNKCLALNYPHEATPRFADMSEILPGWSLRLNVHTDGKGYDVLFQDLTDKCGYAALTDERGVIRQSKAIDCQI